MRTVTSEQMREIESRAMRDHGISELTLMENAGRAVADAVESAMASRNIPKSAKILVFCGGGKNGGDGFVAARHLLQRHYDTEIILLRTPETLGGISLVNFGLTRELSVPLRIFSPEIELSGCGLIVDALLGTGSKGIIRDPYLSAIEVINESKIFVVSVDVPSGLCADTGRALLTAVRAGITVTLGLAKSGLVSDDAKDYVGQLQIADIGLPKELN